MHRQGVRLRHPGGKRSLAELSWGQGQAADLPLHVQLPPGGEGLSSCSFLADHIDGANWHLPQRDVRLLAVFRAPLARIEKFKKRSGRALRLGVVLRQRLQLRLRRGFFQGGMAKDRVNYNFTVSTAYGSEDLHGLSAFCQGRLRHGLSTRTPPTAAGATGWWGPTTSSTSHPRAETRTAWTSRCGGCGITTGYGGGRGPASLRNHRRS